MIMPFGKHRGEHIEDLPNDYLYWLINNFDEEKHGDIVTAADTEYQRRVKSGEIEDE